MLLCCSSHAGALKPDPTLGALSLQYSIQPQVDVISHLPLVATMLSARWVGHPAFQVGEGPYGPLGLS